MQGASQSVCNVATGSPRCTCKCQQRCRGCGCTRDSVPPSVSLVNGGARWWRACNVWPGGTVGLRVGVAGQVEFVPLVVELATVDMIGMCPWALPLSHRVQLVRFQQACFLSVARPSISQGSAMVWFHLSVSGPVRSGNERVAEGTGWLPCWSCRLAPGWICSSLSNVSPPWTWISMCPWGSVPASHTVRSEEHTSEL